MTYNQEADLTNMKEFLVSSLIIIALASLSCPNSGAAEYTLDLGLRGRYLSNYEYKPDMQGLEKRYLIYKWGLGSYYVHYPQITHSRMPVLLALHGAGRTGASMIDTWKYNAEKHSFVVIAPNALFGRWFINRDDKAYFLEIIKDALGRKGIQRGDLYLFGHSNGAQKAIALAAIYPDMFDRVLAHAGTLPLEVSDRPKALSGSEPGVALFLGDNDSIFSVDSGRKTLKWLSSMGIYSDLYILKNHTHWYYKDAFAINERAWRFFTGK